MNCPKCGAPLPGESRFCNYCGTAIGNDEMSGDPVYANNHRQAYGIGDGYDRYTESIGNQPPARGGYVVGDGYYDDPRSGYSAQEPPQQPKKKSKKAIWISVIALVLVAAIAVGVFFIVRGDGVSEAELKEAKENYLPPAEAFTIDTTKEDPSNDNIKFTYDVRKRIVSCIYKVKNKEYEQSYDYDDNKRVVTITVDYKKHPILNKEIDYGRVQKPNEIEIIDGQPIRLDGESFYGKDAPTEAVTLVPTQAPTAAPTQAPTEAPTPAPTDAPTEKPAGADYKELYIAYLNGSGTTYDSGQLIYLNDDDIPELALIYFPQGAQYITCTLCWIDGGEVRQESIDHMNCRYLERSGYLFISTGKLMYGGWTRYLFDGSDLEIVQAGGYEVSPADNERHYQIDGNSVTEEEYNAASADTDSWSRIEGTVDKAGLEEYIRNFS